MFGLFKKKKAVVPVLTDAQKKFIGVIASSLRNMYPRFQNQFELDTFAYVARNAIGGPGSFVFGIYNDPWKKLCDTTVDNFDIRNILFKDFDNNQVSVSLYVSEGLIIGYHCDVPIESINLDSIEIGGIFEKHFLNDDLSEISMFLDEIEKDELKKLNTLSNAYKVLIEEKEFFIIHVKGDGNFLALDKTGTLFILSHDPLSIQCVNKSLNEFLKTDIP